MRINRQPAFFADAQCTYFRSSDIAPEIAEDAKSISVYDGEGLHRSWGRAFVSSYEVLKTRTFAMVLVGYKHKHGGGQGWYYFERTPDGITRRTASQLSTRRRRQVLNTYEQLPSFLSWANRPIESVEKPKREKPVRRVRFKQVALDTDGTLRSIFDGTEYVIGKTLREASKPEHGGGFYVYDSAEQAEQAVFPRKSRFADLPRTIVQCEVWGRMNVYGNGKQSWTYCKPVEVI